MDRTSILLHDYAGHPFTSELSRELAKRGYRVNHAFFEADNGPKGRNARVPCDPEGLSFHPVSIDLPYSKGDLRARRAGDLAYGQRMAELIEAIRPDIILSANTPTEAQEGIWTAGRQQQARLVFWCQDFYSIAVTKILSQRMPGLGHLVAAWYRHLEKRQMRSADHVIHITEDFCAQTDSWGVPRGRVSVIPNWGVIDQIPVGPRDNAWARGQGLGAGPRFLYSGTLGLKHNPRLLAELSRAVPPGGNVVVVAAGVGADELRTEAPDLPALRLLPLQPIAALPEVLASADVLLAVIEADAGEFSVPSKVLSYLCAGRPIVLAAPPGNLAARIVAGSGGGVVVPPDGVSEFIDAALGFACDPARATAAGQAGRRYAEATFRLPDVADRFEDVFAKVTQGRMAYA